MGLLSQNSELRPDGIWNWSIPAHTVVLTDGTRFNTCPHAGVCARLCYAKVNTYRFSNVLAKHVANLERTLNDLDGWKAEMIAEVRRKRHLTAVRIHDAGDFYSAAYFTAWCDIAEACPDVTFYAYTKEVEMVKAAGPLPANLTIIFSFGGTQDHLIDVDADRHADVFPTAEALEAAGYFNQGASDLLAATAPTTRIGIVQNNIAQFRKRLGTDTFSGKQANLGDRPDDGRLF